ncbi:hypothetical protein CsSME_00034178 [Camellia sinensis var. sinensis]
MDHSIDACKDGGIIKKVMEKGEQIGPPSDLDSVLVKYQVRLGDGARPALFRLQFSTVIILVRTMIQGIFLVSDSVKYQVRLDDGAMVATTPEGSRISCERW